MIMASNFSASHSASNCTVCSSSGWSAFRIRYSMIFLSQLQFSMISFSLFILRFQSGHQRIPRGFRLRLRRLSQQIFQRVIPFMQRYTASRQPLYFTCQPYFLYAADPMQIRQIFTACLPAQIFQQRQFSRLIIHIHIFYVYNQLHKMVVCLQITVLQSLHQRRIWLRPR